MEFVDPLRWTPTKDLTYIHKQTYSLCSAPYTSLMSHSVPFLYVAQHNRRRGIIKN